MFASSRGSHAWEHTQRVFQLCRHIGAAEGVDMEVALIGRLPPRYREGSSGCHGRQGMPRRKRGGTGPPADRAVTHCSKTARPIFCIASTLTGSGNLPIPGTAEARVLFDADKLDAIGAVGVARAFQFAGEVGARLHNPNVDVENTRSYTSEDTGFQGIQGQAVQNQRPHADPRGGQDGQSKARLHGGLF